MDDEDFTCIREWGSSSTGPFDPSITIWSMGQSMHFIDKINLRTVCIINHFGNPLTRP